MKIINNTYEKKLDIIVYIPTKNRKNKLLILLKKLECLVNKVNIFVGLENDEYTDDLTKTINYIIFKEQNKGLGYSLNQATNYFKTLAETKYICIIDDNVHTYDFEEAILDMKKSLEMNDDYVLCSGIQQQYKYWLKPKKTILEVWSGCYVFYMMKKYIFNDGVSYDDNVIYSSDSDLGLSIINRYKAQKKMIINTDIQYRKPRHKQGGSLARLNRNEVVKQTYEYCKNKWGDYFRLCKRNEHYSYHSLPKKYIKVNYGN